MQSFLMATMSCLYGRIALSSKIKGHVGATSLISKFKSIKLMGSLSLLNMYKKMESLKSLTPGIHPTNRSQWCISQHLASQH